jgi:heme exporter protein A
VTAESGLAVEVRSVEKRFGGRVALRRVDLHLEAGEFLTLFGPNGAGKTTLSKIIAGLQRPTRGEAWIGGMPVRGKEAVRLRRRVGLLSHRSFLYGHLSARENLLFYGGLYGLDDLRVRITDGLERVGLTGREDEPVRGFSRGMLQRLAIARSLLHEPGLLLLDEPHTGLDPAGARSLRGLLEQVRRQGRTVLMVTHDTTRGLELCDRVGILVRGRLRDLSPATGLTTEAFERRYLEAVGETTP